jgi:putative ABC transport system ATP-binding protein
MVRPLSMIEITNLHKVFNKGKANEVNAVNGVDLSIKKGEFVVIVGSNGSGKTTLLNLIAGSVLPTSGWVSIDDANVSKLADYDSSKWIARGFQKVKETIATLGMWLEKKIEQPMGTLSGGQRQALTLLMSVMDSCKVLLLDEPTAALDPRSADVVMHTAEKLTNDFGLTTILITHNLKDAYNYGTRIIHMAEGVIIKDLDKSPKNHLKQTDLYEWFG